MTKTRIFYYDCLRLMAIIGIIFCHTSLFYLVSDMGTFNFYISSFYDCFRDFSVPIFVMLSGALLLNRKDTLMSFLRRRFSRIFVPFLFWSAVYIIYSSLFITKSFDIAHASDIFFGKGGTLGVIFWFVWMIVIIYFGIFTVNKIGEKFDFGPRFFNALAAMSLIFILIRQFNLISVGYEYSLIFYFISFLSYAFIGYFLANGMHACGKTNFKTAAVMFSAISFFLYVFYICGYVVPQSMLAGKFTYMGYFTVLICAISSCVFLMFKYLDKTDSSAKIRDGRYGKLITELSRYSYGIFLAHYLILYIIKININRLIPLASLNSIVAIPLLVFLTFSCSLAVLMVLDKIPYVRRVNGKN